MCALLARTYTHACPQYMRRTQPLPQTSSLTSLVMSCSLQMPQLYLMPELLAGLLCGFVLLLGTCCGINCLTGIQSPRTFEKKKEEKKVM